uniref:Uncharacterized protein n=1 Tax=Anopheles funestus TaxID=62324 RepID=A0A182R444_ANOFN
MDEIRVSYLVVLLVSVSFGVQNVLAEESEYEYYYEEVNATQKTVDSSSTTVETTTVTLIPQVETTSIIPRPSFLELPRTEVPDTEIAYTDNSSEFTSVINVEDSTDDIARRNQWATTSVGEIKPIGTTDVRRTDHTLTQMNGTRPTKYTTTFYKSTAKPKPSKQPEIVLNIYTGMYGMQSRGKNRPSGNLGGRNNNFWPRAQPAMQGWYGMYGMYNRRPMQSFMPRQNPPVYRGRGPQNDYDDGYSNSFTYHTATKPRRNKQQNRGTAIDDQASQALFNFLLQALGQYTGASSARSQPQGQQGSRRRQ